MIKILSRKLIQRRAFEWNSLKIMDVAGSSNKRKCKYSLFTDRCWQINSKCQWKRAAPISKGHEISKIAEQHASCSPAYDRPHHSAGAYFLNKLLILSISFSPPLLVSFFWRVCPQTLISASLTFCSLLAIRPAALTTNQRLLCLLHRHSFANLVGVFVYLSCYSCRRVFRILARERERRWGVCGGSCVAGLRTRRKPSFGDTSKCQWKRAAPISKGS